MRPPLPLLLAYRLFGWRLGPEHQQWAYDDITRRGHTLRQAVPVGLAVGAILALLFEVSGSSAGRAVPPILGVLVLSFFLRGALRERALRQQGLLPNGDPDPKRLVSDAERRRRNVVGATTTSVLVLAGLVLLATGSDG